jgi:hypothetical protein
MMMVEVNSIDSVPGEAELLAYAANYMAARLFTPRQRKYLNVLIDVTKEPLRVPVTRAMLGPQKSGLGTKAPTLFEMTVSTAFGIRDAAETIAHEMLHTSQAVNERLLITRKKTKIAGRKTVVDMARWMGGKPVVIENLAWHLRPWESEACHWQERLVDEFLGLSTGQVTDQPVQSPKRRQLALYPVSIASPAFVPTQPEPEFDGVVASGDGAESSPPSTSRADSNGASTDHAIDGVTTGDSGQDETDETSPEHAVAWEEQPALTPIALTPTDPAPTDPAPTDPAPTDPAPTDPAPTDLVSPEAPVDEPANGDIQLPEDRGEDRSENRAPLAAMPDRPVYRRPAYPQHLYPRPMIEVTVPGLDAPRALERDAMMKKLSEFRQRGLAVVVDAE